MVTSGRNSICDQCILVAESAFASMPAARPERPEVPRGILAPPPSEPVRRADPATPHCSFCAIAPASGEPLVSSDSAEGIICAVCAEAAAKIVRRRSKGSDPDYFISARSRFEGLMRIAEESDSLIVAENMRFVAESTRAEYERELEPNLPGRRIWRLFTEPTLAPDIPEAAGNSGHPEGWRHGKKEVPTA